MNLPFHTIYDLIRFADSYAKLGSSVQKQLKDLLDIGPTAEVNPNAIEMVLDRVSPLPQEIKEACENFLEMNHPGVEGRYASSNDTALRNRLIRLAHARVASRHIRAFYNPGARSDTGYMPGNVHQEAPYRGVGSQTPTPRDRDGKPAAVPQYGMMKIPGYEWHDKSPEFHKTAGGVKRLLESIGEEIEKTHPRFDAHEEFDQLMEWARLTRPTEQVLRNLDMAAQSFLNWQRTHRP